VGVSIVGDFVGGTASIIQTKQYHYYISENVVV